MCGRYAASRNPEDLTALFHVQHWDPTETLEPDWNIAPTKSVYAVLDRPLKGSGDDGPVRQLRALRWGLVPSWAKTPDLGVKMINARSESVTEKPAFRRAFVSRRCLLPADGYFEWFTPVGDFEQEQRTGKKARGRKQPYFVTPADGSVMAMAGLFEFWRDRTLPEEHPRAWWTTCTVLTADAEKEPFAGADGGDGPQSLSAIHPRMPVVLTPDRYDAWLDPGCEDKDELLRLMAPPPPGLVTARPVSFEVSNVRNNTPRNVEPLGEQDPETLF